MYLAEYNILEERWVGEWSYYTLPCSVHAYTAYRRQHYLVRTYRPQSIHSRSLERHEPATYANIVRWHDQVEEALYQASVTATRGYHNYSISSIAKDEFGTTETISYSSEMDPSYRRLPRHLQEKYQTLADEMRKWRLSDYDLPAADSGAGCLKYLPVKLWLSAFDLDSSMVTAWRKFIAPGGEHERFPAMPRHVYCQYMRDALTGQADKDIGGMAAEAGLVRATVENFADIHKLVKSTVPASARFTIKRKPMFQVDSRPAPIYIMGDAHTLIREEGHAHHGEYSWDALQKALVAFFEGLVTKKFGDSNQYILIDFGEYRSANHEAFMATGLPLQDLQPPIPTIPRMPAVAVSNIQAVHYIFVTEEGVPSVQPRADKPGSAEDWAQVVVLFSEPPEFTQEDQAKVPGLSRHIRKPPGTMQILFTWGNAAAKYAQKDAEFVRSIGAVRAAKQRNTWVGSRYIVPPHNTKAAWDVLRSLPCFEGSTLFRHRNLKTPGNILETDWSRSISHLFSTSYATSAKHCIPIGNLTLAVRRTAFWDNSVTFETKELPAKTSRHPVTGSHLYRDLLQQAMEHFLSIQKADGFKPAHEASEHISMAILFPPVEIVD